MSIECNKAVGEWFEKDADAPGLSTIDEPLCKTHDYTYQFHACNGHWSSYHIEIYEGEGRPPLILCSLQPNAARGGWAVECLAAEVVRRHFPHASEAIGEPFVWLERRQSRQGDVAAGYYWVTFDSYTPQCVLHAHGVRHVALKGAHRLEIDQSEVEELIGHALPASLHVATARSADDHRRSKRMRRGRRSRGAARGAARHVLPQGQPGWRNEPMNNGQGYHTTFWQEREER
jgi:hypothetical protein